MFIRHDLKNEIMPRRFEPRGDRPRRKPWMIGAAILGSTLCGGGALAAFTAMIPNAVLIAPPASVMPGALIGPDINFFSERQDVVLPAAMPVDVVPSRVVKLPGDLTPAVIPAGTCVSSHYAIYEPGAFATQTGGARFDEDILGVALLQGTLDATNGLGAPGTAYPVAANCMAVAGDDCGMELLPQDALRVDARRVEVNFEAAGPGDRIRVITKGNCDCRHPAGPGAR